MASIVPGTGSSGGVVTVEAPPAPPRLPLLAPLRERNFALLWSGNAVSLAGDQFQMVALAVLALELTRSPAVLGAVLMVQAIPRALLMLVGGVVVDRFQPRTVMLASNLLQGLLVTMLVATLVSARLSLWHLYAYAVTSGVIYAFSMPAMPALLPQLVPAAKIRSANALNSLNLNLSSFLYPSLAGLLVAQAGTTPAFVINAATFFVAVAAIAAISPMSTPAPVAARGLPVARLIEGITIARRDPVVWTAIVTAAIFSLGHGGVTLVGLPALAKLTLDSGSVGVGLLFGASGAGAVGGAALMGTLANVRRQGLIGATALLGLGLALAPVALVPSVTAAVPLLVLAGFLRGVCANVYVTLVQSRAPAEARGRVMALFMLGLNGLSPLSLGLGGLLGDAFGPRTLIATGGLVVALSGVYVCFQKSFREVD